MGEVPRQGRRPGSGRRRAQKAGARYLGHAHLSASDLCCNMLQSFFPTKSQVGEPFGSQFAKHPPNP
jgi:hypothetical protein